MSETTIIPKGTCSQCGREDFVGEATDFLCSRCADDRDYDDAQSYRAIARILGIDAADREAVERRVKMMSAATLLINNEVAEWCSDESTKGR